MCLYLCIFVHICICLYECIYVCACTSHFRLTIAVATIKFIRFLNGKASNRP